MSIKNRRFAGARLASQEAVDVTEQLKSAREKLKELSSPEDRLGVDAPNLYDDFEVNGHRVRLNASPGALNFDLDELKGDKQYFGNKETFDALSEAMPTVNYNLTWGVDGGYYDSNSMSRGDRIRVAREVQRRWPELIRKMPENAIVTNSPVGAGGGDFGRADLYMSAGFGPVQSDGQQYGIIKNGQIQPLSPISVQ